MLSVDDLNIVKNCRFEQGTDLPRNWTWEELRPAASWSYEEGRLGDGDRSVCLRCESPEGGGRLFQRIRCAGEQYYRIEAIVRCDVAQSGDGDGLHMQYRSIGRDGSVDEPGGPESWQRVGTWAVLRDYYETPKGAQQLEVEVRLEGVVGRAWIDEVRVIPVEEPELHSHPLAVPPPPFAYPAPRRVRKLALLTAGEGGGLAETVLAGRFGRSAVRSGTLADLDACEDVDAVILQGERWGRSRPSWKQLLARAEKQLVIIGLELFAEIVGRGRGGLAAVSVNEQPDDPIHATVMYANFLTRGYALRDVIPWRWEDADAGTFVQRYIRHTGEFKKFCKEQELVTILKSEGDVEATSGHPVCLYRACGAEGGAGGLVVMDLDPLRSVGGSEDAANTTAYVLFNALGADQNSIGQFVVPPRKLAELSETWREAGHRYREIAVDELSPAPPRGPRWQVTLGREGQTYGLIGRKRPAILLRTGFCSDDWAGMYGVWGWLKQLIRPEPYGSRYAGALSARHRVVWYPVVRPDLWLGGVSVTAADPPEMEADFAKGELGLALDVTASADHSVRLVLPSTDGAYAPLVSRLGRLYEDLGRKRFYCCGPGAGSTSRDRSSYCWRWEDGGLDVVAEPELFRSAYHRAAMAADGLVGRLELPGGMDLTGGHSIWRTDRAGLLVEWTVGSMLGVVAVNRNDTACRVDIGSWSGQAGREHLIEVGGEVVREAGLACGAEVSVKLGAGQTWLVCS